MWRLLFLFSIIPIAALCCVLLQRIDFNIYPLTREAPPKPLRQHF